MQFRNSDTVYQSAILAGVYATASPQTGECWSLSLYGREVVEKRNYESSRTRTKGVV